MEISYKLVVLFTLTQLEFSSGTDSTAYYSYISFSPSSNSNLEDMKSLRFSPSKSCNKKKTNLKQTSHRNNLQGMRILIGKDLWEIVNGNDTRPINLVTKTLKCKLINLGGVSSEVTSHPTIERNKGGSIKEMHKLFLSLLF